MAEHVVKSNFKDKEDGKRQYIKGKDYPALDTDYVPSEKRIQFLEDNDFIDRKKQDLSNLKKAELLEVAKKENVDASESDTNKEIIEKIESKREE